MAHFDTLIQLDTLTFSSSAGSDRQNTDMEVKIQHEYTNINRARGEESFRVHRLLRDL